MAYWIRVTLDDGTTVMRTNGDGPSAYESREAAARVARQLVALWSEPHPDGRGAGKPLRSFEVVELALEGKTP